MKISSAIRKAYAAQMERIRRLEHDVRETVLTHKRPEWHFECRIKSEESFALKVEAGLYDSSGSVEDFLGCWLVVRNSTEISDAEQIVAHVFQVLERRPASDEWTYKRSESFPFDDLRLYCKIGQRRALPQRDIDEMKFEVQIRTFLQHAWSVATHDLVYKTGSVSWGKERIAFQIRAMLEHAEVSILEAESLADSRSLRKSDRIVREMQELINMLNRLWNKHDLPSDVRRIAANVRELLIGAGLDCQSLEASIRAEAEDGRGYQTLNSSPYGAIVQTLLNRHSESMLKYLSKEPQRSGRGRVVITPDIDMPEALRGVVMRNVVKLEG
jgi:ppGpp synthetase/RelA/SpoT-type nucleotidyltranferase